jgi:superfamily II DNA or RNA helicase
MPRICTVRLIDEVNVKLTGIDEVTLQKAASAVTYTVKNSRFMPAVRTQRWSGKKSLVDRRDGSTYRHMLDKVLPPIAKAGYEIDIQDERYKHNFYVPTITNNLFEGFEYGRFKGIMEPHQVDAVNALTNEMGGILKLATGGGKTVITAALSQLCYQFGRVLCIVPRTDLCIETRDTIQALGMPDAGAFFEEIREPRYITTTTWQSLEMVPELFQDVNTLICDECHGADARVLFTLLTKAGRNIPIRFGMTGTLPNDDLSRYNIISALGPVVFEKRAKELQEIGFLAKCQIFILKFLDKRRPEYEAVRQDHQFYIDESRWQFQHPQRMAHLATFIQTVCEQDGNTLVLVRNRDYGAALQRLIPGSIYMNGDWKGADRKAMYDQINRSDNVPLICTYGIASTGINIPRLFNLFLIEPGRESVPIVQSVGRGLRRADDKDAVNIYHVASDAKFSGKHLGDVMDIYDANEYPYEVIEVDY